MAGDSHGGGLGALMKGWYLEFNDFLTALASWMKGVGGSQR